MAKTLSYYKYAEYCVPNPPAFKCTRCGYNSTQGTPPLCDTCTHKVAVERVPMVDKRQSHGYVSVAQLHDLIASVETGETS